MATIDTFRHGIMPHASDEAIHRLLWSCSAYPFIGDVRKLRRSLRKYLRLGGGTVDGAIDAAHKELDRAFEAHRTANHEDPQP